MSQDETRFGNEIAVVGMAGRFPQAPDLERFWDNLRNGVEAISVFSDADLLAAGVAPETFARPDYVRSAGILDGVDLFDAPFFGFSAREAALLDPQQRLFLECAWEGLENAGYDSLRVRGPVGVYGGTSINSYYLYYLFSPRELLNSPGSAQSFLGSDKDFLATRLSYKLGLRGPSLSVQAACSTALVAIHLACQSLLNGECDMALAGGSSVRIPQKVGAFYYPGGIVAPDGHCRAFDAEADGSVNGSGVGVVVLKRLEDAEADGDTIRAVIRGSAVNNDGALRVGYTAPSIEGQAAAVAEALAVSRVEPETVTYVETHGSATPLGDPIEIAALTRAFGSDERGFCAVGSVKTSVGHLDAAAGIAGFVKTVLALEHGEIPPSLNFRTPNPNIDFAHSPFYVNTQLRPWEGRGDGIRRAGVSSFGMGGTNAHIVLEEAPPPAPSGPSRPWQLVAVSAATRTALETATDNLVAWLDAHPEASLPDVSFTLLAGRRFLEHRRAVIATDAADARAALAGRDPARLLESAEERTDRPVAFLLPGLGDHYPGMGRGLYEGEAAFRDAVDRCSEILRPLLGRDLREVLFAEGGEGESAGLNLRAMLGRSGEPAPSELDRTLFAQPALFVIEYALAQLWKEWGVEPAALLGYSLGEYTAACLAGVFSLEDALRVVALRARLIEELPEGAMTAVPLAEAEVRGLLGDELSLCAVNGPELCVVGGPPSAVAALEESLAGRGLTGRRLRTSHAFHSRGMRPAAAAFEKLLGEVELRAPEVPFVSNVSGTWIADEEATDPAYWVRHLLEPVRFGDGVAELWADPNQVLLEVGPGASLTSLALQHAAAERGRVALPSLRPAFERRPDLAFALQALARLWLAGAPLDAEGVYRDERRRRLPLPTYPFERQRYWVEVADLGARLASFQPASAEAGPGQAPEAAVHTTRHARPGLPTPYVAPAGAVEESLAGMWEELLGITPVGTHDSFFDLGGHSLLATQLVARIQETFGVDLPLATLFEANTIASLAARVAAGEGAASAAPSEPRPRLERAPMSFAQQRLWFVDRLAPGITAYNNPVTIRLTGPLDVDALAASLGEIVRRHDILRTTFAVADGEPLQIVAPAESALPVELPVHDLSAHPEAGREAEAWRRMAALVKQPFDLANGPVRRHALLRLGEREHLFVTVMHHILWDEWSQGIFVAELAALYEALRDGRPSPLPELPIQFADYAVWQRETLQGELLEGHLSYWRDRLAGAPRLLSLPTDRPRPAVQSFRGASRPFSFPAEVHRGVAALSQRHGATPFMTLMAAFQTLLWRYTGQDDLLVSTGTGGRGRVDAERLIGCFINILLLRADLSGAPSFDELLDRTRATTVEAFAHQDLPFELLVEALKVERDPSTTPLAQVMLVYLNVPPTRIELRDLTVEGVRVERAAAQLDLTLYLGEENGTLGGHLEYNTDLFEAATVERLLGHFGNLLEGVAAEDAAGRPLTELPILSEAERRQAVVEWNRTAEPFPQGPLHELFEARTDARPGAPALIFADQPFSYQEIDQRANRLAHRLRRLGVGRGSSLGVALRHSPEVVVALQAILKAGGAYVPLDPDYPQERLAYMVESARVQALVTQTDLAGRFAGIGLPTVLVDTGAAEAAEIAAEPGGRPAAGATQDDLVYVIFTSGSTGRPKGVMLDHRGRVSNFHDFNHRFDVGYGDRVLALSSLSFDMSAYDILGTLSAGGALVLPRPEERMEPAAWARMMARHRVSVWHSVPALLEMLVDHLERHPDAAPAALASLRLVLLGGDWIPVGLPGRLRALSPRPETLQIISMGGATEVSMDSTIYEITRVLPTWKSIPYGVPMANQTAYVLSPGSPVGIEPAPVGVAGELVLGGVGVGCGYFGRPELTAEKFVPDALSGVAGSRIYRTGDLARYRTDGVLELLGRMDNQVKIRGFRIEPAEIAAAIRQHLGVREAVVMARQDEPGVKRLVAYLVPEEEHARTLSGAEVRESLKDRLPGYMVPAAFVVMAELPLTPNGKLDRKALPVPEGTRDVQSDFVAPRTPLESVLADAWKNVFHLRQVGVFDNFFDLGGHSLGATRVITQLEEVFPLEIPLRTVFEAPTVAGFAASLEALAAGAGVDIHGIAEVLVEIQEIPDEEVRGLLAESAEQETAVVGSPGGGTA